jgi:hypothetical protein
VSEKPARNCLFGNFAKKLEPTHVTWQQRTRLQGIVGDEAVSLLPFEGIVFGRKKCSTQPTLIIVSFLFKAYKL